MAEPPPRSAPASPGPRGAPEAPGEPRTAPDSPQIRRRGRDPARTRLRNRRYAALQELLRAGDYFSEERMRLRAPALFHHYIGRFRDPKSPQNRPKTPQNPPKILPGDPKNPKIDPKIPKIDPKIPKIGPKTAGEEAGLPRELRELLLSALDGAAEAEDEDDEEEDEDDEEDEDEEVPDEAEQELLRWEFTTRMHQRFLEGLDRDFDYRQVDENPELDELDLLSQELEDRYFDEEEPSQAPQLL